MQTWLLTEQLHLQCHCFSNSSSCQPWVLLQFISLLTIAHTHTHHWNVSYLLSMAGQIAASPNSASPISSQQRGQRGGVPGPKGIAKEAAKALAQGKAPEG